MRLLMSFLALCCANLCTLSAQTIAAFPGAEGFGAKATGGRGGRVIYVTTLAHEGPGSLREALLAQGKRYILFKVSGLIDATADIVEGDVTIAGQTSPGGVIVRGIIADDVYNTEGKADNIIVRHLRSRPRLADEPVSSWIVDDAFRLDGASRVIADHCSFANAADETVQISQSRDITVQHCILAETLGEHFYLGGMLLNYSTVERPQDSISILKSMWNRLGGRMPELSCESPFCSQQPLHIELSNNVLWDIPIQVWYNPGIDPAAEPSNDSFFVRMNLVGNYGMARSSYGGALFDHRLIDYSANNLYASGNTLSIYPAYSDYDLFYCCNDFADEVNRPNTNMGTATRRTQRHDFPPVVYASSPELLVSAVSAQAGAFPRDSMDRRLMKPVIARTIDPTPVDEQLHYFDHFALDFSTPPPAPVDSDNDGMPDYWETMNGLNPQVEDHNGTELSLAYTGQEGYTNIECYLNKLSDSLVLGIPTVVTGVREFSVAGTLYARCTPNPFAHNTMLELVLPCAASARIDICDILGRTVHSADFGVLPQGTHALPLSLDLPVLGSLYFCRVTAGDLSTSTVLRHEP